jgi:hypothetical protein
MRSSVTPSLWTTDFALVLLLKLECFESTMSVDNPPAHWDAIVPVTQNAEVRKPESAPLSARKPAGRQQEPPGTTPTVQMLQIAIPVQEGLRLGYALAETARALLYPETRSNPNA